MNSHVIETHKSKRNASSHIIILLIIAVSHHPAIVHGMGGHQKANHQKTILQTNKDAMAPPPVNRLPLSTTNQTTGTQEGEQPTTSSTPFIGGSASAIERGVNNNINSAQPTPSSCCERLSRFVETPKGKYIAATLVFIGLVFFAGVFSLLGIALFGTGDNSQIDPCQPPESQRALSAPYPNPYNRSQESLPCQFTSQVSSANLIAEADNMLQFKDRSNYPDSSQQSDYYRAIQLIEKKLNDTGLPTHIHRFTLIEDPAYDYLVKDSGTLHDPVDNRPLDFEEYSCNPYYQTSCNLVTILWGNSTSKDIIVVGAHIDTVKGTLGANDNISGVSSLLEIIRVMNTAKAGLKHPIAFCFWGAEEIGLIGSQRFLSNNNYQQIFNQLTPETGETPGNYTIKYYINLDGLASPNHIPFGENKKILVDDPDATYLFSYFEDMKVDNIPQETKELSNLFTDFFHRYKVARYTPTRTAAVSDHYSFIEKGIPSVHVLSISDLCYHKPCDNSVERLDINTWQLCTKAVIDVLVKLTMIDKNP